MKITDSNLPVGGWSTAATESVVTATQLHQATLQQPATSYQGSAHMWPATYSHPVAIGDMLSLCL